MHSVHRNLPRHEKYINLVNILSRFFYVALEFSFVVCLQLEALQPTAYKSIHEYGNRYCLGVRAHLFLPFYRSQCFSSFSICFILCITLSFLTCYSMQGHFGMYQGSSNLQELHGLVKSTVMIRRLKKDVLSELPQKRRQQVRK